MKLTVKDYRAIAGSRFYAQKMKAMIVGLVLLILWFVTIIIVYTPEKQDTVYISPSGVEAVKPYGKPYLVMDKVVWLAEEQDSANPSTGLVLLPLLLILGGALYLIWQEEKAKDKLVEENLTAKDN